MPTRARKEAYFKRHGVPMPKHWRGDADRSNAYSRRRRAERAEQIRQLKNRPCADCGGVFDPVCMDFDHRPGEVKLFELAGVNGKASWSWTQIEAEVAKCDVVCANCHRVRTFRQRDHAQSIIDGLRRKASMRPPDS